jgi:hypothetical protein
MSAPFTVVTLVDEDGDTFPVRLPGVYPANRAADFEAALQIVTESAELNPRGRVSLFEIDYVGQP